MYCMMHDLCVRDRGCIVGEGFFIKSTPEALEVYRKNLGTQRVVKRVSRLASLFTPESFFAK